MFGFYDPASLSIGEKSAVINFINAADAEDVTEVGDYDATVLGIPFRA